MGKGKRKVGKGGWGVDGLGGIGGVWDACCVGYVSPLPPQSRHSPFVKSKLRREG